MIEATDIRQPERAVTGEKFEIICTACRWGGNHGETKCSKQVNCEIVECDPEDFENDECCPKCLSDSIIFTSDFQDEDLPFYAFKTPNDRTERRGPATLENQKPYGTT